MIFSQATVLQNCQRSGGVGVASLSTSTRCDRSSLCVTPADGLKPQDKWIPSQSLCRLAAPRTRLPQCSLMLSTTSCVSRQTLQLRLHDCQLFDCGSPRSAYHPQDSVGPLSLCDSPQIEKQPHLLPYTITLAILDSVLANR